MKIITWNCNMVFRNKFPLVAALKPDILIIPECEHPDKIDFNSAGTKPTGTLWFGTNKHKGLGVFSFSGYKLQVHKKYNPSFRFVVPINVSRSSFEFLLYAIWANNPADKEGRYVTQVWKAINYYDELLNGKKTMLAGDFNSNTIWDKPKRPGNHSTVVNLLEKKGIHSTYHKFYRQKQGKEKHPTLYMYRHQDKPYHIDYCFASEDFISDLDSVEIGKFSRWSPYSDHVPVISRFKSFRKNKLSFAKK